MHFFINKGLVTADLIEKFGIVYWSFTSMAIMVQIFTGITLFRLIQQLIGFTAKKPESNMDLRLKTT